MNFLLEGGDSFDALTRGGAATTNGNLDRDKFNEFLGAHSGAAPRSLKASVGITLPAEPVADGEAVDVALRGLSFSEGPSVTSKVRVSLGGDSAEGGVDNSLVDAHASDEAAVITTDGAGQATLSVTAVGQCEGKAAGEVVKAPVTVDTDFGRVVEAGAGLTVDVKCAGGAPGPSQSQAPGANRSGALAKTGTSAGLLTLVAVVLAGAGCAVLRARRKR